MANLTSSLVSLARGLDLDHIAAVSLPSVVGNIADKIGITDMEVIDACGSSPHIGAYIVEVCNKPEVRKAVEALIEEKG